MSRSESSVLYALNDVKRLETERRRDEAVREAEVRHQAELAEARARAAEAEARRRTEELARIFDAQARLVDSHSRLEETQAADRRRVEELADALRRANRADATAGGPARSRSGQLLVL